MKKLLFALFCIAAVAARAAVGDALKGILPVSDPSMTKSLNGMWNLKVVRGIDDRRVVWPADDSWRQIPVPGCWEPWKFSTPRYDYPDSLTGYYRTQFDVPARWRGLRVGIRLDGVLRGYDLFLNEQYVGSWESGYNTCQFDLTPYLRADGPQQLSMRVYSRFKGYEFDCFDDWATMGIFRDVTLFAFPDTHLSDLTVATRISGDVSVDVRAAKATAQTAADCELLDLQGRQVAHSRLQHKGAAADSALFAFRFSVADPHLWTAETPYLYTLRVKLLQGGRTLQTYTRRVGIREISIDGNVLLLNGRPVKLRGVNAHSSDPQTVKVISDALTLRDMRMMKEASVNYMRLSHYPREPRFYELADSLGFYLVSEVPFGFGDKHLSSRSYQDILMTRSRATVERDKNHPSVIVWSVGNENPLPQTCVEVGDYVGRLDPSRPYCFPQVGSYFRRFWEQRKDTAAHPFPSAAPVYAPHYPTTGQIGGFYQRLDRPVIFTEYCHTLGTSFEDHDRQWEIIERTPGIAGGSVWEWADQGMPFEITPETTDGFFHQYGYEERVFQYEEGGFEMYGNKGTDGLLYANRTPLPNYYELQHNYARASVLDSAAVCVMNADGRPTVWLNVRNRFDFINLKDNVTFHWALTCDRDTIGCGAFSPFCEPRSTASHQLVLPLMALQPRLQLLHIAISDPQGHVFLRQTVRLDTGRNDIAQRLDEALAQPSADPLPLLADGFLVRAGRKHTLAEQLKVKDDRLQHYLLRLVNNHAQADGRFAVEADIRGHSEGNMTRFNFTLIPHADTARVFLSEFGLAMLLHPSIDRVQWIGQGPFASYPGRHQANRYGFWAMQTGDLYMEGNRMGVDAAWFTDEQGNGLLFVGDRSNISFEQTDRGIVVTVNCAVSGLGPKFARTAFPVWSDTVGTVSGSFALYRTEAGQQLPFFCQPGAVPEPFRPFATQYDNYLMRYDDIVAP